MLLKYLAAQNPDLPNPITRLIFLLLELLSIIKFIISYILIVFKGEFNHEIILQYL